MNDFCYKSKEYNKNKSLLSYGFLKPIKTEVKNMKTVEMQKLDITKYVGTMTEIVKAELIQSKFGKVIKIETAEIPLKDNDKLPEGKKLRASILIGVSEQEDGSFAIVKDSASEKFCLGHSVKISDLPDNLSVGDLIKNFDGKKVVCQSTPSGFLTIV